MTARPTGGGSRTDVWVQAARPGTLPAAVAPVVLGTVVAEPFVAWRFLAALVVALGFQVGVNYANDYFDGVAGVDTPDRVGPERAVASGRVRPERMRLAMIVAFGVAVAAGLALTVAVGWQLLAVGVVCLLAALGYSGGPRPYASAALGEVFVFLCFGLVATIGSAYVQAEAIPLASLPAGVAMGLLASAILVANNLRDLPTDAAAGKRTLAVRVGDRASRRLYVGLVVAAFVTVPLIAWLGEAWPALLGLAVGLQALPPIRMVLEGASGRDLVVVLLATARLQLLFAMLVSLGFLLAA
jgi:1,4-dihydroxy-2-naphthoate polyprenyltransferase